MSSGQQRRGGGRRRRSGRREESTESSSDSDLHMSTPAFLGKNETGGQENFIGDFFFLNSMIQSLDSSGVKIPYRSDASVDVYITHKNRKTMRSQ